MKVLFFILVFGAIFVNVVAFIAEKVMKKKIKELAKNKEE